MKAETIKTVRGSVITVESGPGVVWLRGLGSDYAIMFDARNANQLARALRNAALQVEGKG